MKEIQIIHIHAENFKKFKEINIGFGEKTTTISGRNYLGKSSVSDAFSWVLFNKSSTGNAEGKQFRPRRYDENGVNIDHVDVVVELKMLIDGEPVKIRKVQRQNWVRHRGDEYDTYEGDTTFYEWNDVPVTPTDHKRKVADIVSEDVFLLLTNPAAFPTKKEKDQRDFLLKNVANITDEDVFTAYPEEFEPLMSALGKKTMEELAAKNKKDMELYEKKKKELPVRIDQESKHIQEIDFSAEESRLTELKETLASVEEKILDAGKAYENLNDLKKKRYSVSAALKLMEIAAYDASENEKRELRHRADDEAAEFDRLRNNQISLESTLKITHTNIDLKEKELADIREKYMDEMGREMTDDYNICPTCGQPFGEERRKQIEKDFEKSKRSTLNRLRESGDLLNQEINLLKEKVKDYLKEIEILKEKQIEAMRKHNVEREKLGNLEKTPVDVSTYPDYNSTKNELLKIDEEIQKIDTSDADVMKEKLIAEKSGIMEAIGELNGKIALKAVIERAKETVSELQEDMRQTVQSLADCERLKSLIEKFDEKKQEMLSEKINHNFEYVKWQLFRKQKNGRTENVCVCCINGSAYGENTTSTTERMMAGMDIIRCLHRIYGIKAPIFLDDADLYNDWNIPDMDCQLIKLCVSDDEELMVESED